VLFGLWILHEDLYDAETIREAGQARSQLFAHFVMTLLASAVYAVTLYSLEIYSKLRNLTHRSRRNAAPLVPIGQPERKISKRAQRVFTGSVVVLTAAAVWLFISPATRYGMDRAILLSFVLGAWVPATGWLTRASYRAEVPLVAIAFLLAIVIIAWRG